MEKCPQINNREKESKFMGIGNVYFELFVVVFAEIRSLETKAPKLNYFIIAGADYNFIPIVQCSKKLLPINEIWVLICCGNFMKLENQEGRVLYSS